MKLGHSFLHHLVHVGMSVLAPLVLGNTMVHISTNCIIITTCKSAFAFVAYDHLSGAYHFAATHRRLY